MHTYIASTKFAADTLIAAIFHEEEELAQLDIGLSKSRHQYVNLREGIEFLAINPDLDDEGIGQLKGMEAWDTKNEIARTEEKQWSMKQSILAKESATTALCGSLLQIAKQGTVIDVRGESRELQSWQKDQDPRHPRDHLGWPQPVDALRRGGTKEQTHEERIHDYRG